MRFFPYLWTLWVLPLAIGMRIPVQSRRTAFATLSRPIFAFAAALTSAPTPTPAACLTGDPSPDCIGVYKMPLDDQALSYVDTVEKLAKYAPELRWVPPVEYPKNYKEARNELIPLLDQCQALEGLVLKGNLTEVGVALLVIVPRITVAGRVVIQTLYETKKDEKSEDLSMRAYRAEVAHTELLGALGQCDVSIGQALRGELGALAPAQIQILEEIRDANSFFQELVRVLPEKVNLSKGSKSR